MADDTITRCIHCNQEIVPDTLDGAWFLHLTTIGTRCENMDTLATPPYMSVECAYWDDPAPDGPDMLEDVNDLIRLVRALAQCNICGAVVSDRKIHADWHGRRP